MPQSSLALTSAEKHATFALAALFAFRMLGLFMIIPVFALYAQQLQQTTPLLIGIALGCYGLTQALLQIPLGIWSDYAGRKFVIAFGLVLFAAGSIICALTTSIWGIIIGRSLQGAGAVGSTIIALLADVTRTEVRTQAMAIIGITIAMAFSLGFIIGPILNNVIGVKGIFWLTTLLAISGFYLLRKVPTTHTTPITPTLLKITDHSLLQILLQPELLYLNFSIMCLHAVFTATFVVLPLMLQQSAGLMAARQWHLYLPVLLLAFVTMPFLIRRLEPTFSRTVYGSSILGLGGAEFILWYWQSSVIVLALGLWLFFTAFTLLEALLPSRVSKVAPPARKGAALGIYSSCQFLGIFLGGCGGGWVYARCGADTVILGCLGLAGLWLSCSYKQLAKKYQAH